MTAIKPRTAKVVIYQGDDLDRLSQLEQAAKKAEEALRNAEKAARASANTPRDLSETNDEAAAVIAAVEALAEAKDEHDLFAEEAEERGVIVVLKAQPRKKWRDLVDEHPARDKDEHPEDYQIGPINVASFPDVLIPKSVDYEASTIDGDLEEFLESLSDYDYYDRLFLTAFALNRGSAMADPTQRLASGTSQTSSAT